MKRYLECVILAMARMPSKMLSFFLYHPERHEKILRDLHVRSVVIFLSSWLCVYFLSIVNVSLTDHLSVFC